MTASEFEFAGDRITLVHQEDGTSSLTFDDKGTGRICGACQLCCKLPPIPGPPLHKPAGVRCQHAKAGKGCSIYADRPLACRAWACRWLADKETTGMPRPDRCHYVIDCLDDYIEMIDNETGARTRLGVIQVWVDPAFRNAYRAPELRAYMARMAADHGMATIIRYSSVEAITVFPPALCDDGQWMERRDGNIVSRDETDRQIMADRARHEAARIMK